MSEWKPKLKNYHHFDCRMSSREAELLATDPVRVSRHSFYPFLRFHLAWNRFAKKGGVGTKKIRPIRYAARADAYIFSYYRHLLSGLYEAQLAKLRLTNSIIAYRRIPIKADGGGKCNIHHVLDAVNVIRNYGNCYVIALDISSFFESIDHAMLKTIWCRLLDVSQLPKDHFKVFSAITSYAVVNKEDVFERLGFYGTKRDSRDGRPIRGYLKPLKDIPLQICRGAEFRNKIAGGDGSKSLVEKNKKNYGIPQGAPISDLLANMYLIDFDHEVMQKMHSGSYMRYSDDILLIAPVDEAEARNLETQVRSCITKYGKKLQIKKEKSFIFEFAKSGLSQRCKSPFENVVQCAILRKMRPPIATWIMAFETSMRFS